MALLKQLFSTLRQSDPKPEPKPTTSPSAMPVAQYEFEGLPIKLAAANQTIAWRAESFYSKEPDTVAWLTRMPKGSVLLDVGANIGIYTLAAAVGRGCKVYAFEPESQNYGNLNANIALNNVADRVTAYCAALTDHPGLDHLFLSRFDKDGGGSCHSYGEEVGFDLEYRPSPFTQGCVGLKLDELVEQGSIPVPDFIKIDVDGFEHKVVAGAMTTLSNPKVKEILIEINPNLESHRQLILTLRELGFYYSLDQRQRAARKEGTFKNVGEIIFRRIPRHKLNVSLNTKPTDHGEIGASETPENVLDHILNRIESTSINETPYPFIVVDDFFPQDYYQTILRHFPTDDLMVPLSETGRSDYDRKDRLVALFNDEYFARLNEADRTFWLGFADWLYSDQFIQSVIDKFLPYVACRLADLDRGTGVKLHGDALIVSDKTNYSIGPHTDAPHRLITFLFYLPKDESQSDLGTSIYRPLDQSMEFSGNSHHSFDLFERVDTVAFKPNRALIFVRNNRSFHGVEPITREGIERHLVINNIRIANQ